MCVRYSLCLAFSRGRKGEKEGGREGEGGKMTICICLCGGVRFFVSVKGERKGEKKGRREGRSIIACRTGLDVFLLLLVSFL